MKRPYLIPVLVLSLTGCAALPGILSTVAAVVSRVDVATAIRCADLPNKKERARCVGAATWSPALDEALDQAAYWGDKALDAASPTGAEVPPAEERRIAVETERALDRLALEVAEANAQ